MWFTIEIEKLTNIYYYFQFLIQRYKETFHLEIASKKGFLWWFLKKYTPQLYFIWLEPLYFSSSSWQSLICHWMFLIVPAGSTFNRWQLSVKNSWEFCILHMWKIKTKRSFHWYRSPNVILLLPLLNESIN